MTTMQKIAVLLLTVFGFSMALAPAFVSAQTGAAADASVNVTTTGASAGVGVQMSAKAMADAKTRADKELDRRVQALTSLNARVQAMQKVTDTFKTSLATNIDTQISAFQALKTKIDGETDGTTIKADVQSITDSYRVYALVLPQIRIAAAADREVTISFMMQTLGNKLAARIQAASNAGGDVKALTDTLNDFATQISTASTKAQAAVEVSAPLAPDNGDKDTMAKNKAALAEARTDLNASHTALVAGRKDIDTIVKALVKVEAAVRASATASSTTTVGQ
ncbi:MAG TPA: hypothetical protein VG984_01575 [Candidatus Paceibacterota bacterium]|nr:hypothetical protein [Candidatus Paceibacterota bacterium]